MFSYLPQIRSLTPELRGWWRELFPAAYRDGMRIGPGAHHERKSVSSAAWPEVTVSRGLPVAG